MITTAQLLRSSGVAVIPVKPDKTPLVSSWKQYRTQLPTDAELTRWFSKPSSLALVGGKVQAIDIDEKHAAGIFQRYVKRAEECGLDQLIGECILQKTPSGGFHLVFQCEPPVPNLKLASSATHETLIETRGDGGYFLISPSPNYTLIQGDWSSIPTLTPDDREALLTLARTFDEKPVVEAPAPVHFDVTPGDDFDFRADVPALLKQHGWKPAGSKYWTRPGKPKGISASWDVVPGRFYVFSSSTQFDPMHVYRPWHVYAMLECGGDYSKAASELRRQGFGGASHPKATQPLPSDWNPPIEPTSDEPPSIDGVDPSGDAPTIETPEDKIRRLFRAREFDPTQKPPELRVVFTLKGVVVATPGNICAITAQAKVGKSALVQGFVSATMTDTDDADCLGVKGFNSTGKGCIYLDTEQSKDDFWRAIDRARKRAIQDAPPAWFKAYGIGDLPVATIRQGLAIHLADYHARFGGIHAVFIDGVADMVLDVNDAEECNKFVSELFTLATRYDCSIITVIHKNPGSDKTRGHLGSQIERKAETNLTLDKEDAETVVWSVKQRRAPIFKNDGLRFAWSDEAGMHVSVKGDGIDRGTTKARASIDAALRAFAGASTMRYLDLVRAISKDQEVSEPTAKNRIAEMRKSGVLTLNVVGSYELMQPKT